jgi:FAD/FMN-containing dehydrogenase
VPNGFDADTHARLVALKEKFDPTNIFRFNHNIRPYSA